MFSSLVIEIMVEFITQRLGGLQFNRFVQSFRWICGGKGAKSMCGIPFQVFQSLDISDEDSKRIIQLIICEHWCAIKLCCHLKGWQSEMMLHLIIAVYILVNQFGLTLLTRWHKCLWWWFIRQLRGQQDENQRDPRKLYYSVSPHLSSAVPFHVVHLFEVPPELTGDDIITSYSSLGWEVRCDKYH